jgi:hypothetical protein
MRICEKCGESFVPRDKKETVCLFCQSLEGLVVVHRFELDRVITLYTRTFDEFGVVRGSGLTGKHKLGTNRPECSGQRAAYRYKKKPCVDCNKIFYPEGPQHNSCGCKKISKSEIKENLRIKNLKDRLRRGEITLEFFNLKVSLRGNK